MNSKQKLTRRCGLYLKVGKLARMLHKTVNIIQVRMFEVWHVTMFSKLICRTRVEITVRKTYVGGLIVYTITNASWILEYR